MTTFIGSMAMLLPGILESFEHMRRPLSTFPPHLSHQSSFSSIKYQLNQREAPERATFGSTVPNCGQHTRLTMISDHSNLNPSKFGTGCSTSEKRCPIRLALNGGLVSAPCFQPFRGCARLVLSAFAGVKANLAEAESTRTSALPFPKPVDGLSAKTFPKSCSFPTCRGLKRIRMKICNLGVLAI